MSETSRFWDKSADRYSKAPIRNEAAYQKKLEITRSYLKPDTEMFEFGCGTGSTAIAHSPYVKNILAIDVSSRMLEISRQKADAAKIENISFKQSTIEEFEDVTEVFDVAMAHSILHLLPNPEAAMQKVYNMLKPGGIFITNTHCLGDGSAIWRIVVPVARFFRLAPYVNIIKRSELEEFLINSGFEIDYQSEPDKKESAFIVAKKKAR